MLLYRIEKINGEYDIAHEEFDLAQSLTEAARAYNQFLIVLGKVSNRKNKPIPYNTLFRLLQSLK